MMGAFFLSLLAVWLFGIGIGWRLRGKADGRRLKAQVCEVVRPRNVIWLADARAREIHAQLVGGKSVATVAREFRLAEREVERIYDLVAQLEAPSSKHQAPGKLQIPSSKVERGGRG